MSCTEPLKSDVLCIIYIRFSPIHTSTSFMPYFVLLKCLCLNFHKTRWQKLSAEIHWRQSCSIKGFLSYPGLKVPWIFTSCLQWLWPLTPKNTFTHWVWLKSKTLFDHKLKMHFMFFLLSNTIKFFEKMQCDGIWLLFDIFVEDLLYCI